LCVSVIKSTLERIEFSRAGDTKQHIALLVGYVISNDGVTRSCYSTHVCVMT